MNRARQSRWSAGLFFFVGGILLLLAGAARAAELESVAADAGPEALVVTAVWRAGGSTPEPRLWVSRTPPRAVLEFSGLPVDGGGGRRVLFLQDPLATAVRVEPWGGGARLVLDLRYPLPPSAFRVERVGERVALTVDRLYRDGFEVLLAPGVEYGQLRAGTPDGPAFVNYLKVDLSRPGVRLRPALAGGRIRGRETVGEMVARTGALAGVNASFFGPSGRPLGLLMIDGELVAEPLWERSAVGWGDGGRVEIGRVGWRGELLLPGGETVPIGGVNRPPGPDEVVLLNRWFGPEADNWREVREYEWKGGTIGRSGTGPLPVPAEGGLVVAHGAARERLAGLGEGAPAEIRWQLVPDWPSLGIRYAVGGGPRLLADGRLFLTTEAERFREDVAVGRAPRTAVGRLGDGRLLLLVVSGRQEGISVGLTLRELALLAAELGAVDAVNLDGGGSSTLVLRDWVANFPSEGRSREVASALLVFSGGD